MSNELGLFEAGVVDAYALAHFPGIASGKLMRPEYQLDEDLDLAVSPPPTADRGYRHLPAYEPDRRGGKSGPDRDFRKVRPQSSLD